MSIRTRHSVAVAAALLLPVLLAGCGDSSGPSNTPKPGGPSSSTNDAAATSEAPLHSMLPADLQGKDSITIASNVEYPPFEFLDKDSTTVLGIDRDIADALEKELGLNIEFENIAFDAIIPGLAADRYQMAMSAMTDNKERQKEVDFVDYFKAGAGVMAREADATKYATITDLCGVTAGLVKGTTEVPQAEDQSKKCVAEGKPAIESVIFPGQNQVILALQNNRVDVVLMDSAPGAYAASQAKGLVMNPPYQSQPFGIVFAKGNTELQKAVQKGLENIKASGEYDAILKKWGLESGAVDAFPINGATE